LQSDSEAENSVFCLSDLVGKTILAPQEGSVTVVFLNEHMDGVTRKIGEVAGETFRAGLGMPNHFSATNNAFEVFGFDFLLGSPGPTGDIPVYLLEINACPDFKQSGPRLHGIIQRLFEGVLRIAVKPFFKGGSGESKDKREAAEDDAEDWQVGTKRGTWLKCADEKVELSARPW